MSNVMGFKRKERVAPLTLNRPDKLNALDNELLAARTVAFEEIELDSSMRAIVITGAGCAFSAGTDIAAFQIDLCAGPTKALAYFMRSEHCLTQRVESLPKPIITVVNGLTLGHIALVAKEATFSKAEINTGIISTFGGIQRLPRTVGRKAAIELIVSGWTFDAAEAARLGLVNRVVPAADLLTALTLASELASKPPLTLAAATRCTPPRHRRAKKATFARNTARVSRCDTSHRGSSASEAI